MAGESTFFLYRSAGTGILYFKYIAWKADSGEIMVNFALLFKKVKNCR